MEIGDKKIESVAKMYTDALKRKANILKSYDTHPSPTRLEIMHSMDVEIRTIKKVLTALFGEAGLNKYLRF